MNVFCRRKLSLLCLGLVSIQLTGCACGGLFGGGLFAWRPIAWPSHERNMIPERYPLGSVVRAHNHAMQTNAEASDFVFNLVDFVGESAHLTPDGKDHVYEVAARMRSAPFPVIIERTPNNADPELDMERRAVIARMLADLGNGDADQRTFVATAYNRGLNGYEGEADYYQNFGFRGLNNNNFGTGSGGFGGGGGGGGGFR